MNQLVSKAKYLFEKYDKYLSPTALVFGFVWDNLTLTRIDLFLDNFILLSYLIIAGIGISLIYILQSPRAVPRWLERISYLLPLMIQFAFGGLFSGYVVFYSRGGTFSASWIFLLLLASLLIGNEFFREKYHQLRFKITIYYVAIFSFLIFFVPVVVKKIGGGIFILSGLLSLLVIYAFLKYLGALSSNPLKQQRNYIFRNIGVTFIVINLLYFTNIIPPLPLSLKEIDLAHNITRVDSGSYIIEKEKFPWYSIRQYFTPSISVGSGDPVYVFSAIFSPTDLDTQIFHHWQYFDEEGGEWITTDRLSFAIFGGRDGGSRGYSIKRNVFDAKWRVDVETERGQLIGRQKFEITTSEDRPSVILQAR